jgi:hypothetical protein
MDNPFAFQDPQAALEQANTYRETQKLNSIYQSSLSEDNWYYWANLWQNWPKLEGSISIYFSIFFLQRITAERE